MKTPRIHLGNLSVGFVHMLVDALHANGLSADALLAQYAPDAEHLATARARLSIPRFMRLGHAAIQASGNPAFGLQMGLHSRLAHLGLAGVTAAQAPDLDTLLRTLVRLEPLYAHNYRGHSRYQPSADGAWLSFYSISPYNDYNRFVVDAILAGWCQHLREAFSPHFSPDQVQIEYPAPEQASLYQARFACPVHFAASHNRLHLARDWLEQRNPAHCPSTWQHLLALSEQELERITRTHSLREQVVQHLGPLLNGQEPRLEDIARRLRLAPWTLRRRLQAEGVLFRDVLNDTRRDLAILYLRDTESSPGEIAYLLGFNSSEAFQRAFKRWTGQPPGSYRRTIRRA